MSRFDFTKTLLFNPCDNTQMPQPGQPDYDKLFKVREFLEDLMAYFRLNYNPHREQAIDEAMMK